MDVLAFVDKFIHFGLYQEDGKWIQTLIDYPVLSSTSTFKLLAFTSTTIHLLNIGLYCLRAGLLNDGAVSMDMFIEASISGVGFIENECCNCLD